MNRDDGRGPGRLTSSWRRHCAPSARNTLLPPNPAKTHVPPCVRPQAADDSQGERGQEESDAEPAMHEPGALAAMQVGPHGPPGSKAHCASQTPKARAAYRAASRKLELLRGLPSQVLRLRGLDCSRRPLTYEHAPSGH
jgi:hypothetical protein